MINLTKKGIMMQDGAVIHSDVNVGLTQEGAVYISYYDKNGIYNNNRHSSDSFDLMYNTEQEKSSCSPTGLLTKNDNWYTFWKNQG